MDNNIHVLGALSTSRVRSADIWPTMEAKVKTVSWEPEAMTAKKFSSCPLERDESLN